MVDHNYSPNQQGTASKQALSQTPLSTRIGAQDNQAESQRSTANSEQEIGKATKELDSIRIGELWLIGLNFGLFVVGAAVCIIYGLQLSVMRGQLAVMRDTLAEMKSSGTETSAQTRQLIEQARAQADAAKAQAEQASQQVKGIKNLAEETNSLAREGKRSADAAQATVANSQKNLALAEESLFVQERPWVGISEISATVDIGKPITGKISFNNYGKSPAFDLHLVLACNYSQIPFPHQVYQFIPITSEAILMPGTGKATDDMSCNLLLNSVQFSSATQGTRTISLWGSVLQGWYPGRQKGCSRNWVL